MVLLECQNCERAWNYKGTQEHYATCPSCHYKVNVKTRKMTVLQSCRSKTKNLDVVDVKEQ